MVFDFKSLLVARYSNQSNYNSSHLEKISSDQQAGKFNIVPLLLNVGSGIALLGIVSSVWFANSILSLFLMYIWPCILACPYARLVRIHSAHVTNCVHKRLLTSWEQASDVYSHLTGYSHL